MERVGLVVHPTRPVLDSLEVIGRWATEHGLELVQLGSVDQLHMQPAGEVARSDLIVALGGDGTILKALHKSAAAKVPVLRVAYASRGPLPTVPSDDLPAD